MGRIQFVRSVDEVVGDKMLERFDNLNWILYKDYDKSNIYHIR